MPLGLDVFALSLWSTVPPASEGRGTPSRYPQGTSILSPVIPFSLVVVPAFIIFQKSESNVYQHHPSLYIMAFGMVAAKVTNRLVVSTHIISGVLCDILSVWMT